MNPEGLSVGVQEIAAVVVTVMEPGALSTMSARSFIFFSARMRFVTSASVNTSPPTEPAASVTGKRLQSQ